MSANREQTFVRQRCSHMRREPSEAPLAPLLLGVMLVLTIFAVLISHLM